LSASKARLCGQDWHKACHVSIEAIARRKPSAMQADHDASKRTVTRHKPEYQVFIWAAVTETCSRATRLKLLRWWCLHRQVPCPAPFFCV
jgi:hypothetical protein